MLFGLSSGSTPTNVYTLCYAAAAKLARASDMRHKILTNLDKKKELEIRSRSIYDKPYIIV